LSLRDGWQALSRNREDLLGSFDVFLSAPEPSRRDKGLQPRVLTLGGDGEPLTDQGGKVIGRFEHWRAQAGGKGATGEELQAAS